MADRYVLGDHYEQTVGDEKFIYSDCNIRFIQEKVAEGLTDLTDKPFTPNVNHILQYLRKELDEYVPIVSDLHTIFYEGTTMNNRAEYVTMKTVQGLIDYYRSRTLEEYFNHTRTPWVNLKLEDNKQGLAHLNETG